MNYNIPDEKERTAHRRSNRKSIPKDTLLNLIKSAEECAKKGTERMKKLYNEDSKDV